MRLRTESKWCIYRLSNTMCKIFHHNATSNFNAIEVASEVTKIIFSIIFVTLQLLYKLSFKSDIVNNDLKVLKHWKAFITHPISANNSCSLFFPLIVKRRNLKESNLSAEMSLTAWFCAQLSNLNSPPTSLRESTIVGFASLY